MLDGGSHVFDAVAAEDAGAECVRECGRFAVAVEAKLCTVAAVVRAMGAEEVGVGRA